MCMQMRGPHFSLREQERGDQRVCLCLGVWVFEFTLCVLVSMCELLTYSNSISSFQSVFTAHITVGMRKCPATVRDIYQAYMFTQTSK